MASIEYVMVTNENITLLNANDLNHITIIINLAAIYEKLQRYTHVHLHVQINVPIINGNLQEELDKSFKVSDIQDQKVSLEASFSETIDENKKDKMHAKVSVLYYNLV